MCIRDRYSLARRHVEDLFDAFSAAHFPFRFDFNQAAHDVLPWSLDLLETYTEDGLSPLEDLYHHIFDAPESWDAVAEGSLWIPLEDVDFAGVSVVFPSQIPEAFYLCRFLKSRAPGAVSYTHLR